MKRPGITALAHPLDPEVATRHGVFVFESIDDIRRKYIQGDCERIMVLYLHLTYYYWCCLDPSCPSTMSKVKKFLHKVSVEKMKKHGAVIPETKKVVYHHTLYLLCQYY